MEQITAVQLFAFIIGFGGVVSLGYAFIVWVKDPKRKDKQAQEDKQQDIALALAQQRAEYLEKELTEIKDDIKNIKNNHLKHIEADISSLKSQYKTIHTILEERLPKK